MLKYKFATQAIKPARGAKRVLADRLDAILISHIQFFAGLLQWHALPLLIRDHSTAYFVAGSHCDRLLQLGGPTVGQATNPFS